MTMEARKQQQWWTIHATITPHLSQWHRLMWCQDKSATSMNANTIKWHDNNNRSAMTATMMEWPRDNDVVPSIPTPEHIITYHYHDAYRSTHTIHRPAISLDTATYNSLDDATSHHQLDKLCIKSTAISLDTATCNLVYALPRLYNQLYATSSTCQAMHKLNCAIYNSTPLQSTLDYTITSL